MTRREEVEGVLDDLDHFLRGPQLRRWSYEYSPRRWVRKWSERARKGWSVEDTFDFDGYLSNVIAGGVQRIRDDSYGHPADLEPEVWLAILEKIIDGFTAHNEDAIMFPAGPEREAVERREREGLSLFAQYFGHLWD